MAGYNNNSASNRQLRGQVADLLDKYGHDSAPRPASTNARSGTNDSARSLGGQKFPQFPQIKFRGTIDPNQPAQSCLEYACGDLQMCGITNPVVAKPILAGSLGVQQQSARVWIREIEDNIRNTNPSSQTGKMLSRALAYLKRFQELEGPHQGQQRRGGTPPRR